MKFKITVLVGLAMLTIGLTLWCGTANAAVPKVTITSDKLSYNNTETIHIRVASNSSSTKRINVYYTGGYMSYCVDRSTCDFTFGPWNRLTTSTVFTFYASAIDARYNSGLSRMLRIKVGPNPTDSVPPVVAITTDKSDYVAGETMRIRATASDNFGIKNMKIFVDGGNPKTTCASATVCTYNFYLNPDNNKYFGFYTIWAQAVDNNGNNGFSVEKDITVNGLPRPATTTSVPPTLSIVSSKDIIKVGETGALTASVVPNSKVVKNMEIWLQSVLVKNCASTSTCSYVVGPYDSAKILPYYLAVNFTDGTKRVTVAKNITVVNKDNNNEIIGITSNKTAYTKNDLISFTARAKTKMKKINILVNARVVKECLDADVCAYTGGPYTQYGGTAVSFGSNSYDTNNVRTWTGYKTVTVSR